VLGVEGKIAGPWVIGKTLAGATLKIGIHMIGYPACRACHDKPTAKRWFWRMRSVKSWRNPEHKCSKIRMKTIIIYLIFLRRGVLGGRFMSGARAQPTDDSALSKLATTPNKTNCSAIFFNFVLKIVNYCENKLST
jgi:hypothetical protein